MRVVFSPMRRGRSRLLSRVIVSQSKLEFGEHDVCCFFLLLAHAKGIQIDFRTDCNRLHEEATTPSTFPLLVSRDAVRAREGGNIHYS